MRLTFTCFAVVGCLYACKTQKAIVKPGGDHAYTLTFSDEFNQDKLNTKTWVYRTDSKQWSTQMPANVTLAHGHLLLNVKKEKSQDKEYTGAGIITAEKFGFGYYEASFKIPKGAGWHNSFWLMTHDGSGGTSPKQSALELDICENDSKNRTGYNLNVHRWQEPHIQKGTKWIKTPDLGEGFHKWGCEYTKVQVKYYFDGELVQTIDISAYPHTPMNIWLTTIASFHGNTTQVDDSLLPNIFEVDYVRYYKPIN